MSVSGRDPFNRRPAGLRRRVLLWLAPLCLAGLACLAGCGEPTPQRGPEFNPGEWDMYVSRHLGRALGRMQFAIPTGWKVVYQHDITHPRLILANRADLTAADVSYLIIGLTEENVFDNKKFDGPPAVWNAADFSPEMDPFKRELLDRKKVVEHHGRMGQGVTWRSTQTSPAIGDWEFIWAHDADPGPGAVDRDKQRVNKFDLYLAQNPGAPLFYFREYYTRGWGLHRKAWLQIYYRAQNEPIRRLLEALLPTVDEYTFSEDRVTLLGGAITRAAWNQIVADEQKAAALTAPAAPATPAAPVDPTAARP